MSDYRQLPQKLKCNLSLFKIGNTRDHYYSSFQLIKIRIIINEKHGGKNKIWWNEVKKA